MTFSRRAFSASLVAVLLVTVVSAGRGADDHPRLNVSANGRFLVYEDGRPFFWLGDTVWELFHRCDREEAALLLEDRARKGFTVIQAVALAQVGPRPAFRCADSRSVIRVTPT